MTKNTSKTESRAAGDKTRRFTKKTKPKNVLCKQITHSSDITGASEEEKAPLLDLPTPFESHSATPKQAPKRVKRRKSESRTPESNGTPTSPVKRQKITEASNNIEDKGSVPKTYLSALKPLQTAKTPRKAKKAGSPDLKEVSTADTVNNQKPGGAIIRVGSTSP